MTKAFRSSPENMKTKLLKRIVSLTATAVCLATAASGAEPAATGAAGTKPTDPAVTGEEAAVLTQAPNVPPPIKRKFATRVIVNLEVREVTRRLADGLSFRPLEDTIRDTLKWNNLRTGADSSIKPRAGMMRDREQDLLQAWKERV